MGQILLRRPRLHQIAAILFLSSDAILFISHGTSQSSMSPNPHMDACSVSPRTDNNVSEHTPTYSFLQKGRQVEHIQG
jgi:hypothetical protein